MAPQLGVDASRYILGEIISKLEGDDDVFALGQKLWRQTPEANTVRDNLMGRIQLEAGNPGDS